MKLSNKILLGFFGFAFLYLSAAFVEIRVSGIPNFIDRKNSVAETVSLSGIRYVVVDDVEKTVTLSPSDEPRLEVRSLSGNMLKRLTYRVSNDTLTLSAVDEENSKFTVHVYVPENGLEGIAVNKASVSIAEVKQAQLHLAQDDGDVWMSGCQINTLKLTTRKKSHSDVNATIMDTLSVDIEESHVSIHSPFGALRGSLRNDGNLRVNGVEDIQLKKDKSSSLSMYQ